MSLKYRTFENRSVKDSLDMCLKSGYMPSCIERVYLFHIRDEISSFRYHTRTMFFRGIIMDAPIEILENIEPFYKRGGRLMYYDPWSDAKIACIHDLNEQGRFLGMRILNDY